MQVKLKTNVVWHYIFSSLRFVAVSLSYGAAVRCLLLLTICYMIAELAACMNTTFTVSEVGIFACKIGHFDCVTSTNSLSGCFVV